MHWQIFFSNIRSIHSKVEQPFFGNKGRAIFIGWKIHYVVLSELIDWEVHTLCFFRGFTIFLIGKQELVA